MKPTLIYDAECRLCVGAKKVFEFWDFRGKIEFLPFQQPAAKAWVPEVGPSGCLDAMRLVDPQGSVCEGAEALRRLLPLLPAGRGAAWILRLPGVFGLAEAAYGWVARNRYRLFGRSHASEIGSDRR